MYKNFLRKLFPYIRPHISKLVFASLTMVIATALETAIPEMTGQIVDNLFQNERDQSQSLFFAVILFIVLLLSGIFALISTATSSWVSNKVIMDLRVEMFEKLMYLPKKYFDNNNTGNILSKLTFDVEQIAAAASTVWLEFLKSSVTVLVLVIYLFYKNLELSIILLFILPIIFLAVKKSSQKIRSASSMVQNSMGDMTHLLDENISGNSIIKIYHAQEQEKNKFHRFIKNVRQQRFKVDVTAALNTNLINILLGLALSIVVFSSSISLGMSAGEFLSYFTALAFLIKPSKKLININKPLQIALAAGKSVFDLLDQQEEPNLGKIKPKKFLGHISFKNVYFNYEGGKDVIKNINLEINAGETIAIVGPTGSGKSTLIDLIAKFYRPSRGEILIDGININDLENDSLRKKISYVDQNTRLFNESIFSNIALGQIDKITDNKVKSAAKKAEAIEFISELKDGFDSLIGENGSNLSGGQRQRLAIARAIAKDSPILILDEATSALDSKTEKLVQRAINEMSEGRTSIIIAHRLSTIQSSDRIVVLDKGSIVEIGTHKELLENKGFFAKLIESQFD